METNSEQEFKAFDKVLMRNYNYQNWVATFFSNYANNKKLYINIAGTEYLQCIPYKGNEKLCGTNKSIIE